MANFIASTAFIVYHFDLPDIFDQPDNCHLFIDDLAILYMPSMFISFQQQLITLERKIYFLMRKGGILFMVISNSIHFNYLFFNKGIEI